MVVPPPYVSTALSDTVPEPISVRLPVAPLTTPPSARVFPLLSTVAVTLGCTLILLARVKLAAPDCSVLLPVTLTSPAPSAVLLPTCNMPPPLNVVPTVPVAGP